MRRIIFIILGVLIVAGGGWYWYAKSHQVAPGVPAVTDFSAFFPIGDTGDPTAVDGVVPNTENPDTTTNTSSVTSAFTQLSPNAVAGFASFIKPITITIPADPKTPKAKPTTQTTFKHFVRYVSRGNGYVYEIEDGSIPLQISNVYIPNIYETLFGDSFTTTLLRFLRPDQQTIATYSVPIPAANTDGSRTQKEGVYFADNITTAATSPDGSQVASIVPTPTGATLVLSTTTNTKKSTLLQTPFREWLLSWPTAKSLYLQTKASAQVPGYLYRVDTGDKKLRRVLGNINGLTTSVSPSGTYILYSQHSDNAFVTRLFNTKTNTTKTISVAILPEKCTWLKTEDLICAGNTDVPAGEYPDAWYQGTVTLSDRLYRIYTTSLTYDTLYDNNAASFDMTNLGVDESTNTLYFIDKPTGLLWQMKY